MDDSSKDLELLEKLLRHDLTKFAKSIGLSDTVTPLTDEDAAKLLNIAETYSRNALDDITRYKCLTICGLMWEHKKPEWYGVSPMLIQILTRLGLGPSAKMVDSNFDHGSGKFGNLVSYIAELFATKSLIENEVKIGKENKILLSSFQKRMWDAIDSFDRLGISAPTSAGKSYVLVNKIIDILLRNPGEIVYIVPTISLINQVSSDLRKAIKSYKLDGYDVVQSYSLEYERTDIKRIYVLTQERAVAALTQHKTPFRNLKLLIVDEIQNIERVADENEERAHNLLDVIHELNNNLNPNKIIISGPRLKNLEKLVKKLFGENAGCVNIETPPVVNITYSFSKESSKIFLKQYSILFAKPISITVDIDCLGAFGKKTYDKKIYSLISKIIQNTSKDSGTLVFSPTSAQAVKTAESITELIKPISKPLNLSSLQMYISETVHPEYSLIKTLEKGIAFHHGHLPQHIRIVVEKAFAEKYIHTIACTTTLMQGVNLPAKNLIARSPYLFTRENKNNAAKLTSYEFANLRGRAGRLMKDVVGRAIVLDEESFEESSDYLCDFPDKELDASYGVRFNQNKDEIIGTLRSGDALADNNDFNDLIVYIRQMILKYGIQALDRIKKVDIDIDEKTFSEVKSQLEELAVSKNICTKNPYWDPLILDQLYISVTDDDWVKLPKSPFDENFVGATQEIIDSIKNITPYYHKKYFDVDNKKREWSIVKYAQSWSQEKSLAEILKIQGSAKIDDTIALISKEVSFSLPKLLRPVIHIQDETNPILNFIEVGAYNPETRRLIEYGIPRETAIRLTNIIKDKKVPVYSNNEISDALLKQFLNNVYSSLNYWEKIQMENFINTKI